MRLTARVAAAFNNNKRPGRADWNGRRGVVERISNNKVHVFVLWEGRKTPDEVPIIGISHRIRNHSERCASLLLSEI